ncbi:MAG: Exodeoxyribonuclease 7 large subunit [candidate division WS6 bacterium OLB20]|uniref:Exodeoxyribonuclease 7 large subunit n=1 Tax=candidate division WS6 bacterium OLB20 TaxID=1617426 RepID=A0A136LXM4_9BACT|nr:MAG: Exodeoxyribonuclease 7 large subunit [candidate division WS6 bacterium OLB20]
MQRTAAAISKGLRERTWHAVRSVESALQRQLHILNTQLEGAKTSLQQFPEFVGTIQNRLSASERLMQSYNPSAVLKRGYALVASGGRHLSGSSGLTAGDHLEITMHDGIINSIISDISNDGTTKTDPAGQARFA